MNILKEFLGKIYKEISRVNTRGIPGEIWGNFEETSEEILRGHFLRNFLEETGEVNSKIQEEFSGNILEEFLLQFMGKF